MQLGPQPARLTREQHLTSLGNGERTLLHEDVAELCQRPGGGLRDHFVNDQPQVLLPAIAKLARDNMGRQQSRNQALRYNGGEVPVDLEQPQLLVEGESVAALGLHRCHAEPKHLIEVLATARKQAV